MEVLLINTVDRGGGAARVASQIMEGLTAHGHKPHMFVGEKRSDDDRATEIPRRVLTHRFARLLATDIDLWRSDWILDTPQYKEADIVHCHNLHGGYFKISTLEKMARDKPLVWTLHDEWATMPHGVSNLDGIPRKGFYERKGHSTYPTFLWDNTRYLRWRKRRVYEHSRLHLVAVSSWHKNKLSRTLLANQPTILIYNGVDCSVFRPAPRDEARRTVGLPVKKKIVAFVSEGGRHNVHKGWPYAEAVIERFQARDEVCFVCIGGQPGIDQDEARLKFVPYADDNRLALYYAAADALLFSSLNENFPLVPLEAMACGLPVVTFDVGGVKESVAHKTCGYIARYGDPDDLASGVSYVLGLPENERAMMSAAARRTVAETFTADRMIAAYLKLYETLENPCSQCA
jgi:glycosyltransferase involved in cell wall biosynthesis